MPKGNTIEQLAGGVIVCGFPGTDAPQEVRSWLARRAVAGLILFKRNIEDIAQVQQVIASCTADQDPSSPFLIGVDQEGGRVARLGHPVITLPPMRALGDAGDRRLTSEAGTVLGRQLRSIGINLDFAPVLDVDTNPANPVIGDRAFGSSPEVVVEHALAFAEGLHTGGVLSCGKHFPGHGDTDVDSHLALPTLRHDRDRLDQIELAPFRAAVGRLPSLMTAHVVFESLDNAPATLSEKVVEGVLRGEVGFEGAVFTDDLEMRAVRDRYAVEESGLLAIEAGCDILLVCSDVDATGRLRERLIREAESRSGFRLKLERAKQRADQLRATAATLPARPSPKAAFEGESALVVASQLERLG